MMGVLYDLTGLEATSTSIGIVVLTLVFASLLARIVQNLWFHPLSGFPGPWYAASFSFVGAVISVQKKEPQWLMPLVRKYGGEYPVRVPDARGPCNNAHLTCVLIILLGFTYATLPC